MLITKEGIIQNGRIELLESTNLSEGTHLLVTLLQNDETQFWAKVRQKSLEKIWNNPEDDIYAGQLEK